MKILSALFFTLVYLVSPALEAGQTMILKIRPGVDQAIWLESPKHPKAVVMLFGGGGGRLRLSVDGAIRNLSNNFLIRSRNLFIQQGFVTVLVDAPSDRQDQEGLRGGFRRTSKHARDIGAIINFLRKRYPGKPVWLIGTSRGSSSVVNAAIRLKGNAPSGIVLTSSVTRANRKGTNVFEMPLKKIRIPTLIVHHKYDHCSVTPFRGAKRLFNKLNHVADKQLIVVKGGQWGFNPCKGSSSHGFLGREHIVVDKIGSWIKGR